MTTSGTASNEEHSSFDTEGFIHHLERHAAGKSGRANPIRPGTWRAAADSDTASGSQERFQATKPARHTNGRHIQRKAGQKVQYASSTESSDSEPGGTRAIQLAANKAKLPSRAAAKKQTEADMAAQAVASRLETALEALNTSSLSQECKSLQEGLSGAI